VHSDDEASDFLPLAGCAWISARVSVGSEPRGFPWHALAASTSAETSTDLRGVEGRRGHLVSLQRLPPLAGSVVCIPLCRSAASLWQPLRNPAAKPASHWQPLWLPLHCAAARFARLRSVPRQPKPPRKEHQEKCHSSLPFSFSPCSLIKSTTGVSRMLARRGRSAPLLHNTNPPYPFQLAQRRKGYIKHIPHGGCREASALVTMATQAWAQAAHSGTPFHRTY